MALVHKVYGNAEEDIPAVQYIKIDEHRADVFLRKNYAHEVEHDVVMVGDGEDVAESVVERDVVVADELFFQVDASAVTEDDVQENFQKYWLYGQQWTDMTNMTEDEKLARLRAENEALNQCFLALCDMI